jgi:hypothetical protein
MELDYLNATYGYEDLFYPGAMSNSTWNVTVTRGMEYNIFEPMSRYSFYQV